MDKNLVCEEFEANVISLFNGCLLHLLPNGTLGTERVQRHSEKMGQNSSLQRA